MHFVSPHRWLRAFGLAFCWSGVPSEYILTARCTYKRLAWRFYRVLPPLPPAQLLALLVANRQVTLN